MTEPPEYVLGMEPAEVERLQRQHSLWQEETASVWELAGFTKGQTIVDLGCGPGFAAIDLARLVGPSGRVVAVDSSPEACKRCRLLARTEGLQNIEVMEADAARYDPSSCNAGAVFARWLFSYLSAPEATVKAIAAGLRTGGAVAVMDYWNYLSIETEPKSALFSKVYGAVYASVASTGGSFDVGGRLPAMFESSGLDVTRVEVFTRVGRPGSQLWTWLTDFQRLYLPTLADKGYLGRGELEEFWSWWDELSANSAALLFAPPVLAVVGVKR